MEERNPGEYSVEREIRKNRREKRGGEVKGEFGR